MSNTLAITSPINGAALTGGISVTVEFDWTKEVSFTMGRVFAVVNGPGPSNRTVSKTVTWTGTSGSESMTFDLPNDVTGSYSIWLHSEFGGIFSNSINVGYTAPEVADPHIAITTPGSGVTVGSRSVAIELSYDGFVSSPATADGLEVTLLAPTGSGKADVTVHTGAESFSAPSGTISLTGTIPEDYPDGAFTVTAAATLSAVNVATALVEFTLNTAPFIEVTSPEPWEVIGARTVPVAVGYGNFTPTNVLSMKDEATVAFDLSTGSGTTVNDQSPNDHDGTLVDEDAEPWGADGLAINGTGGRIELDAADVNFGTGDFSIVWISKSSKDEMMGGQSWFFADQQGGPTYQGLAFARIDATTVYLEMSSATNRHYWDMVTVSAEMCPLNAEVKCALTVDRDGLARIYRNGTLIGSQDVSSASAADLSSTNVFRAFATRPDVAASSGFAGSVKALWIFQGRVLSGAEVTALHATPMASADFADHLRVVITPPAGGGDPIVVVDAAQSFDEAGTIALSGTIPDTGPNGDYEIVADAMSGASVVATDSSLFTLEIAATPTADDTRSIWDVHSPQLGTDDANVPINTDSADFDGVLSRGMFVLDEEPDLVDDPAETYNLEAAYDCPGETESFAEATLIDDMHHSFALVPADSRTVRWFLRAKPRQFLQTAEVAPASLVRLGALDNGDVAALALTPHQVLRVTQGTLTTSVMADLSDLGTAPTDMACGGGKVFVAAGDVVVVLDQDAGDQRFDMRLGVDVTGVTALAWTGTMLVAGVAVTGGGHRLVGWTYPRYRDIATWDHEITTLAMLGGNLYAGDDAGQVLTVSALGAISMAHATTQASVTRLALQGNVALAGTGDAGKLYSSLGAWSELCDFGFSQVRGLAVVDGWLWAGGAGGSGGGHLWRQGNSGWVDMYAIADMTAVNDMIEVGDQILVAGATASVGKLAMVQFLPAGDVMVSNEWVEDETKRSYQFVVLASD